MIFFVACNNYSRMWSFKIHINKPAYEQYHLDFSAEKQNKYFKIPSVPLNDEWRP